jgi:hypothetical protein
LIQSSDQKITRDAPTKRCNPKMHKSKTIKKMGEREFKKNLKMKNDISLINNLMMCTNQYILIFSSMRVP